LRRALVDIERRLTIPATRLDELEDLPRAKADAKP
jgi:hypothetical protein